jgi:hypothetical protein
MRRVVFSAVAVSALALPGCTSEQLYATGQGWQRNECNKLIDGQERQRCLNQANTSYETYERQREAVKSAK